MLSRVAVIRCDTYDEAEVNRAVQRGLSFFGGASALVRQEESILLKPNMLAASAPGKAVTTHPAVFSAVARALAQAGARLSYGDSPGIGNPRRTAATCGIMAAAEVLAIPLADFVTSRTVSFPQGRLLKQLKLAAGALDADGIVSLPKMKTHALTRITGAVKNQFGCVPGFMKGEFHVKMPDIDRFCQVLIDINLFLRPRLYVMDGIEAMAGNGPRGGDPFPMRVLLFSTDPLALDAIFCRLIAIDPDWVPTLKTGHESGLGHYHDDEIEVVGDELGPLVRAEFPIKRAAVERSVALWPLPPSLKRWLSPRPVIKLEGCKRCGDCLSMCPVEPKALVWKGAARESVPVYDYGRCIRCYCCQEICPAKAITVEVPILRRLLARFLDR